MTKVPRCCALHNSLTCAERNVAQSPFKNYRIKTGISYWLSYTISLFFSMKVFAGGGEPFSKRRPRIAFSRVLCSRVASYPPGACGEKIYHPPEE